MRKFTDNTGEKWKIDISVGTILDVQSALGYDMTESLESLPTGIAGQASLIAVLCSEQIESRGLSEREFATRLNGQAFADAIDCVLRELADFFLSHKPALGQVMQQCLVTDKEKQEAMASIVEKALSSPSSSWRGLSASTPGH